MFNTMHNECACFQWPCFFGAVRCLELSLWAPVARSCCPPASSSAAGTTSHWWRLSGPPWPPRRPAQHKGEPASGWASPGPPAAPLHPAWGWATAGTTAPATWCTSCTIWHPPGSALRRSDTAGIRCAARPETVWSFWPPAADLTHYAGIWACRNTREQ